MKMKSLAIVLFLFDVNTISAQSTFDKWPAIKEFHEVMYQTFHPSELNSEFRFRSDEEEQLHHDRLAALRVIVFH